MTQGISNSGNVLTALRSDERIMLELRRLYKSFGYTGYKVGRFEEYDLYAHNKSFLVSENVLTFTDTNGKLMALKPDVTLSIVKNAVPHGNTVQKLYYNENVYRTSSESHGFKEIMQTGLECIGYIDSLAECEVVMLAARSLKTVSEDFILDISHMGIAEGLLDIGGVEGAVRDTLLSLIKSRSTLDIRALCDRENLDSSMRDALTEMTSSYTRLADSIEVMAKYAKTGRALAALENLREISSAMDMYGLSDKVYFDLSLMNDISYYDGIIFKGFISGIPDSVLSGGRYDRLVRKLGKDCSAIGFAVYLDTLERYGETSHEYDVDVLLLYDTSAGARAIADKVGELILSGKSVRCAREADGEIRYRTLMKIDGEGVKILEAND